MVTLLTENDVFPTAGSTYHASLVLRITGEKSALWKPVALFEKAGTAEDYAEMCDTYAEGFRYVSATVACTLEDLMPITGDLPLFRRTFPRETFPLVGRKPCPNASTAEGVMPAKLLHATS